MKKKKSQILETKRSQRGPKEIEKRERNISHRNSYES
jgi:hypothetical protein